MRRHGGDWLLEHADCLCRGCLEAAAPAAGEQAEA
jgi:hypothetical protein